MYRKTCRNCGDPLPRGSYRNRLYCSDLCRVAYNRYTGTQSLYNDGMKILDKLGRVPDDRRADAISVLKELKSAINAELLNLGDADATLKHQFLNDRSK